MKTFFVVALYALMVAALDLGGAIWTSFHTAQHANAPVVTNVAPAKNCKRSRRPGDESV